MGGFFHHVIRRAHITKAAAEQNAHAALKVAQRGYVIESGTVAMEGDRDTLIDNPDVRRAYIGV